MAEAHWNPWRDVERVEALEKARNFWSAPGAFPRPADDWVGRFPAPPTWPPGWRAFTPVCQGCPHAACKDCPCRAAWMQYLNPEPPHVPWWRRLIAQMRGRTDNDE